MTTPRELRELLRGNTWAPVRRPRGLILGVLGGKDVPLHRVWEYRDIGRLFITVGGGESVIIGVLKWGWVEVILRVSLEVILHNLLRHAVMSMVVSASAMQ